MGFTNRVDVRGRQKMLEAPRGCPPPRGHSKTAKAMVAGDDDGDALWRSTAGARRRARGRRPVRARGRSAGEGGHYGEATGFIAED